MKYIAIVLILIFTSCDCGYKISGYVLDSKTKSPIINAKVRINTEKRGKEKPFKEVYTDSLGYYSSGGLTGGGFLGCPELKTYAEVQGYHLYGFISSKKYGGIDTIYLEKE